MNNYLPTFEDGDVRNSAREVSQIMYSSDVPGYALLRHITVYDGSERVGRIEALLRRLEPHLLAGARGEQVDFFGDYSKRLKEKYNGRSN